MTKCLFVLADDMRYDSLPYMPFTNSVLRGGGTLFTNSRCDVPICQAARIGFLTGQYAKGDLNHVWQNNTSVENANGIGQVVANNIGLWLQAQSVTTAFVGKCPNNYRTAAAQPGWDFWRIMVSLEQEAIGWTLSNGTTEVPSTGEFQTTALATKVIEFIESQTPEDDWFCWYTPTNPHCNMNGGPFQNNCLPSPAGSTGKYRWKTASISFVDDPMVDKPTWVAARPEIDEDNRSNYRHSIIEQLRECYDLDLQIERIYNTLVAEGQLDDTLIIFSSDNGAAYGEHREGNVAVASKDTAYEYGSHVPTIVYGPSFGVPAGGTNLTPCNHSQDIHATVMWLFGATPSQPGDGTNLLGLITTPNPARTTLYERRMHSSEPDADGVFTNTMKLIRYHEGTGVPAINFTTNPHDEFEMYDFVNDPDELTNLAWDPDYLTTRNTLEGWLDDLLGVGEG